MVYTSKDGATTYDYTVTGTDNRVRLIDHTEELFNDYAVVVLYNGDNAVPDLTGYWTEIGYGDVTGSGNEYIGDGTSEGATARLWVKHQQGVLVAGDYYEVLELEGMWARLADVLLLLGEEPYHTTSYTTDTIYAILEAIIETNCLHVLSPLVEDDSIMSLFTPAFNINNMPYETAKQVVDVLMAMTKSYLRPKAGLTWEVKFPQTSDAVDATYYNYQAPYFTYWMCRRNVTVPNHILVYSNEENEGWDDIIIGEAEDTDATGKYDDVYDVQVAASITTQAWADQRAAAILAKYQMGAVAGRLVTPHDARIELMDKIAVNRQVS
jgi:hypothetical protein